MYVSNLFMHRRSQEYIKQQHINNCELGVKKVKTTIVISISKLPSDYYWKSFVQSVTPSSLTMRVEMVGNTMNDLWKDLIFRQVEFHRYYYCCCHHKSLFCQKILLSNQNQIEFCLNYLRREIKSISLT